MMPVRLFLVVALLGNETTEQIPGLEQECFPVTQKRRVNPLPRLLQGQEFHETLELAGPFPFVLRDLAVRPVPVLA